jgi:hypothetical protein
VAHAAEHEEPNDTLGLGLEMRVPIGQGPGSVRFRARDAIAIKHGTQNQPCESHAAIGQEDSTLDTPATTGLSSERMLLIHNRLRNKSALVVKIGDWHQIGAVKSGQKIGVSLRNLEPVTDFRLISEWSQNHYG